jgi:hypothetical protein
MNTILEVMGCEELVDKKISWRVSDQCLISYDECMFKTLICVIPNETKISSINTPLSREQFHICIEF